MKTFPLVFITLLIVFSACQPDKSDNSDANSLIFSYEIDTVQIDSKSYFFYLSEGLGRSFLAKDGKTLYNLNQQKPQLEVIDLATLALKDTIPLEREGPSGIGTDPFYDAFQVTESGDIFFFVWRELVKLNANQSEVEKFRFENLKFIGDSLQRDEAIRYEGLITEDGKFYFSFYGRASDSHSRLGLVRIGLEDQTLEKINLPIFEELVPYEIKLQSSNEYPYTYVEPIYLTQAEDQLLVSASPFNEIYSLNISSLEFEKHSFNSLIAPNRVEITYNTMESSEARQTEAIWERWKQVSFYGLSWDNESKKFWRITNQTFMESETKPNQIFLTFFDRDLNQLGEVKLPENWKIRGAFFFGQGMYWQFITVDDEMAFVRFKPEFSD